MRKCPSKGKPSSLNYEEMSVNYEEMSVIPTINYEEMSVYYEFYYEANNNNSYFCANALNGYLYEK